MGLPALRQLALSWCNIQSLPAGIFAPLKSLQTIDISGNLLHSLPHDIFVGLNVLRIVDVGSNMLSDIHDDLFRESLGIEELYFGGNQLLKFQGLHCSVYRVSEFLVLHGNHISALTSSALWAHTNLVRVEISGNSIAVLPENLLSNCSALETLDVTGNRIEMIPPSLFLRARRLRRFILDITSYEPFT